MPTEDSASAGPRVTPATPASYPTDGESSSGSAGDAEKLLDEFPINFNAQK
jgi:hypothetical protein